jgi:hypothetical protein
MGCPSRYDKVSLQCDESIRVFLWGEELGLELLSYNAIDYM